ncbi:MULTISPECIES: Cof-type HAD-IIB family hydrolase [unclassified Oceanobacillus]|uniref:Cof-type HAD-IIB family hydrolase n=1 Tax=unclassified Oceanobacillus TaxID=2630292 RepID=UPI00084EAFC7|nr:MULTISPECIES: Cof-type HAD-IIB family hydrolase [unclassified Oceanobacillus]MBT2599047.1 Cof-type HAD-IIB family hydrolase [Oceanobacillus sp. ISL-74]MBT2651965.1 Cof-type HAD-IIB family hydrolase [Oceanobacillus sp. ISL-73]OEH54334.1 phosphatase [Oceanobacillus sp. E9]
MTKKQKHLIAVDLDGTLLKDNKTISSRNKNTLHQAMNDGHIVVIATGRPHRASINYYHELGLKTPMVNFNGALVHHPLDASWKTLHTPMPIKTAHRIIDASYELQVKNILAEVQDEVYMDVYNEEILEVFQDNEERYIIGDIKSKLSEDPTSVLIHPKENHIKELRSHLDDYHAEIIEHRKWGAPWNIIEIIRKGMNKAVGLQNIAKYYDIPKERIIAFGDEDNDLEMIDYAGVGVSMGNAIDSLVSISKHQTVSNEEDGISIFLEEYLQLSKNVIQS